MQTRNSICAFVWGIFLALLLHQSGASAAKVRATSPTVSLPHTPSSRWPLLNENPPLAVLVSKFLKGRARAPLPPSVCTNPSSFSSAGEDECAYYETCLEEKYHCGKGGYPLGYGKKACESLVKSKEGFDDAGKKWMEDKERCIQQGFGQAAFDESSRRRVMPMQASACESVKTRGLETTSQCFVESGICKLGEKNWTAILTAIGKEALKQQKDSLAEKLKAKEECKEAYEYFFKQLNF